MELIQVLADVFAGCLVVAQNKDAAVFGGISVDIVGGDAVVPDSTVVGYFASFFAYNCTRVLSNLRP